MAVVTMSAKGQLVIPKAMRESLGLAPGVKCRVEKIGKRIVLRPIVIAEQPTWHRWRGRLRGTRGLEDHIEEHRREIAQDARGL